MMKQNIADATDNGVVKLRATYAAPTVSRLHLKKTEAGSGLHFDGFSLASVSSPP